MVSLTFDEYRPSGILRKSAGCRIICTVLFQLLLCVLPQALSGAHAEHTLPSVVVRLQQATVRVLCRGDRFSGVIVSPDGLILTAAHGLKATETAETARVQLHDGRIFAVSILEKHDTADVAVLRIMETVPGLPKPVRVSPAGSTKADETAADETVLAAGYPGREEFTRQVPVRIGHITSVDKDNICSTCVLTSGDSGGPLVNLSGVLVGLNRRIGVGAEKNFHVPIGSVRRLLRSAAPDFVFEPSESGPPRVVEIPLDSHRPDTELLCRYAVAFFFDTDNPVNARPRVSGTLFRRDLAATKLSMLEGKESLLCRLYDGSIRHARILRKDFQHDLAVLSLSGTTGSSEGTPSQLDAAAGPEFPESAAVPGTIVYSCPCERFGMISRVEHDEPPVAAVLGATLADDNTAEVIVKAIVPNGPAAESELQPFDEILSIDHVPTRSLENVADTLRQRQPGDWIALRTLRKTQYMTVMCRLQRDPATIFERSEFLDGRSGALSDRRTGLSDMLQHDIPILPEQCGGPLCDHEGRLIGLNIARRSREATLAVPVALVLSLADSSSSGGDSDQEPNGLRRQTP